MLAGLVLRQQGIEVVWVSFETPFFSAEKARAAARQTGIHLIVKDITGRYLSMLQNPPAGYGQFMNPCMDCHALMFKIAGEMMSETGADFMFSGEVLGQRPMSQVKGSLRYVEKRSGCDGLILRPLSARKLPITSMEQQGLVDREKLLDFSGRSRKSQMAMAQCFGITDYPAPAGGCLLTDAGFAARLKDLMTYRHELTRRELELLRYGRHFRLNPGARLIVGRNKEENDKMIQFYNPAQDSCICLKNMPGPLGIVAHDTAPGLINKAAAICAGYSKAPLNQASDAEVIQPGRQPRVISVVPVEPQFASQWMILPCR